MVSHSFTFAKLKNTPAKPGWICRNRRKKIFATSIFRLISKIEIRIKIFSIKSFVIFIIIAAFYTISIIYFAVLEDIPSPDKLMRLDPRLTTTIYDRKGNILYRVYSDEDRMFVKLSNIPESIINATIAIEDQTFFTHSGLSLRGIVRAAQRTLIGDGLEGGSTITQQLVKNSLLTPRRTLKRKIKEAIVSIEVERKFTKEEILEMYLNRISYGGTAYGIKSASRRYFGKELDDLTLSESAYLAGLPAAPSRYSPYGEDFEKGKARQYDVLNRMVIQRFITKEQADEAFLKPLIFKSLVEYIKAPHFVNYVIADIEKRYGQMLVQQGGLDVFTSLDMELQIELEKIVERNVSKLNRNNVKNGAALITNPKTGEILAMVGSVNYWDIKNDGNVNVTISRRQPGSSIKPITYALALENGFTPMNMIEDIPISYKILGQKDYKPVNYDGKFHGKITLKSALANSYNVPAVKLLDQLGIENLINFANKLGITTWTDPSKYGLSLTLGAGEVRMVDMAVVYGTFANRGYKKELNAILKIYDSFGNVLEENDCVNFLNESPSILTRKAILEVNATAAESFSNYTFAEGESKEQRDATFADVKDGILCQKEKTMRESTAYIISNILSDNKARSAAFGVNSSLNVTARQFAVKTGTTTNEKDNWTVGYSDDYVIVSWVGNNNGEPTKNIVSGYRGASTIWREAVNYIINNRKVKDKITVPSDAIGQE